MRNHDGSVFVDPNNKNLTVIREQLLDKNEKSTKTESVHELNENGDAVFTLNIAKDESRFSVTVMNKCVWFCSFQDINMKLIQFVGKVWDTRNSIWTILYRRRNCCQ